MVNSCDDFSPEASLFVGNKWEHVPVSDRADVQKDVFHKLNEVYPGITPDQIHYMSVKKVTYNGKINPKHEPCLLFTFSAVSCGKSPFENPRNRMKEKKTAKIVIYLIGNKLLNSYVFCGSYASMFRTSVTKLRTLIRILLLNPIDK